MNEAEFEEFFAAMYPRLLRRAQLSLCPDDAHEAASSALTTVWTKRLPAPTSRTDRLRLEAWTFTFLLGEIRNKQRGQARRSRLVERVTISSSISVSPDPAQEIVDACDATEIDWLLGQLRPKHRQVVMLVMEGYHVHEIAEALDISPGATSMRLARAKDRLARMLRYRRKEEGT
ncbi:sigma-70 family RNA polymerase sigma factor [Nocardioides sp. AE5]|uniref:RNA polymerase sigma factor n=1 Tax=Nocardioides sp. AE5 TaxID=2962573 RepID=UPI002882481E|nr:sigma-70 family RNA polymerase sigma factor [Nocardioides sp. AE5]MDT0200939.1 sigma-70 family RNA polymerase sigma factor [Nocardioides sp. AE5]